MVPADMTNNCTQQLLLMNLFGKYNNSARCKTHNTFTAEHGTKAETAQ